MRTQTEYREEATMKAPRTRRTLMAVAVVTAVCLTPLAALADGLDDMPIDAALVSADILASEAEDVQFEAEARILANRTVEARDLFLEVQDRLNQRGELLIYVVNEAPTPRIRGEAEERLRHNKGWMARTARTIRTLSIPVASND